MQQLAESDAALAATLDRELPYTGAEVVWAARHEMARTLEDVVARRTRALFLNAPAALRMAPTVAHLMAVELGHGGEWEVEQLEMFRQTARNYVVGAEVE